ncbi:hypothetical protein ACROYT_G014379 [Oculina patagonica]
MQARIVDLESEVERMASSSLSDRTTPKSNSLTPSPFVSSSDSWTGLMGEIQSNSNFGSTTRKKEVKKRCKKVTTLLHVVSEKYGDSMSCVLANSFIFGNNAERSEVRDIISDVANMIIEAIGSKKGLSGLLSSEIYDRIMKSMRVPDWILPYFKLQTKPPDSEWQTLLNLTQLGKNNLKPDNVLLEKRLQKWNPVIIDFGKARFMSSPKPLMPLLKSAQESCFERLKELKNGENVDKKPGHQKSFVVDLAFHCFNRFVQNAKPMPNLDTRKYVRPSALQNYEEKEHGFDVAENNSSSQPPAEMNCPNCLNRNCPPSSLPSFNISCLSRVEGPSLDPQKKWYILSKKIIGTASAQLVDFAKNISKIFHNVVKSVPARELRPAKTGGIAAAFRNYTCLPSSLYVKLREGLALPFQTGLLLNQVPRRRRHVYQVPTVRSKKFKVIQILDRRQGREK